MNVLQVILILNSVGSRCVLRKNLILASLRIRALAVFSITGNFKGMRGFRFDFRESAGGGCKDACGHA